jgi:hypothetical protein
LLKPLGSDQRQTIYQTEKARESEAARRWVRLLPVSTRFPGLNNRSARYFSGTLYVDRVFPGLLKPIGSYRRQTIYQIEKARESEAA